jgi:hypothetical protein
MLEERKMSGYIELRNYVLRRACAGPVLGGRKMGRPHTDRQETLSGRPNDLYKSVVNFVVFHFIAMLMRCAVFQRHKIIKICGDNRKEENEMGEKSRNGTEKR